MRKQIRLILAVVLLAISISTLVWGYWPNPQETRVQIILPTAMQLPLNP